ncbi:MAG: biotin--[Abditibacteriota bacterium]|nr:biotin--[acetyl-CoA-carboxylase] ligase [Abditibacteriota bacterium]
MLFFHYDTVDSTMDQAAGLLPSVSSPFCVTARTQTRGRGKPGRKWHDTAAESLLITFAFPCLRPAGEYSFAAGLAVRRTLLGVCGLDTRLKWVNDLYAGGRKLCGILCEKASCGGAAYMTIGIGINVRSSAFPPGLRATSVLLETGRLIEPQVLTLPLSRELERCLELPFDEIIGEWSSHMLLLNERASVACGSSSVTGVIRGVDREGRLLVETGSGLQRLSSGTFL